jgi:hypothetical protein
LESARAAPAVIKPLSCRQVPAPPIGLQTNGPRH